MLSLDYPDNINALNTKNKFVSALVGGQYSKRSSIYYGSFDKSIQLELEKIALIIKPRLEKKSVNIELRNKKKQIRSIKLHLYNYSPFKRFIRNLLTFF